MFIRRTSSTDKNNKGESLSVVGHRQELPHNTDFMNKRNQYDQAIPVDRLLPS